MQNYFGIKYTLLIGLITGCLLGGTTVFWQFKQSTFFLPIIAGFWWLIIFGCSLWLAYKIARLNISKTKGFALQVGHAALTVAVYGIFTYFNRESSFVQATQETTQQSILQAGIYDFSLKPIFIIPAAFILCIITSGLLYSILSKPSSK